MPLRTRTENVLRSLLGERFTVADVARLTDDQILATANAGKQTAEDIREWLAGEGASFDPSRAVVSRSGPRLNGIDEKAVELRRSGLSYAEIASQLGVSIARARQRAFKGARQRLQIDDQPGWGARVYEYLNQV